ncbi:MAG TPA: glycosyltransferase family 2 protein [Ramlibacter sp.]|uniref:glycosyltransferase family 2 protein n=1 Tax=Ramlibacter sp. TaxID=1917967 RepID=UPI002D800A61|nr:glycosyltransferase family 2 protein [Ramlibacter sp.]HET8744127.1 glycosyltransferase family 2 protein [Ramlibacter sp.]
MKQDLVSIITPAYKAAAYVGDTIASALAQSYGEWEMLIADDCSPDDTRAVVAQWAERDPRVRLLAMTRNGGPAAARNAALAQAQGRWIAFLDSDDLWLPAKLERSLAHAQANGAALVFTGFRRISFDGSRTGDYIGVPRTLTYRQLLGNTAIATSTVLIDRAQCGEVWMKPVFYDDFACWLEILKRGFVAHGLDEDLMRYRVMPRSVSRNKKRSAQEVWKAYRQVEGLGPLTSAWHFTSYALHALRKYRQF